MNSIRLEPATTARTWEDGKFQRQFEHHFLDIVIDERSLRDLVHEEELVTQLSRPWVEGVPDEVERFLGRRSTEALAPDRVAILVYPVDGDLGCGALTARLQLSEGQVEWTDWLWESYQEPIPVEVLSEPFVFDRREYEDQFESALLRIEAMPYDELAHHGKRFLWPWQWGW